jgi:hypothetical protein
LTFAARLDARVDVEQVLRCKQGQGEGEGAVAGSVPGEAALQADNLAKERGHDGTGDLLEIKDVVHQGLPARGMGETADINPLVVA